MPLRTFVFACLLVLPAGAVVAAERSIPLDTGQVFTINWGADWLVGGNPPDSPPGTLTINGPDARLWRIAVGPLPPNPSLAADPGNLRMYVRIMARGMENAGIQVDPEHHSIDGRAAHGLYVKAHDGHKKTKAEIRKAGGDFTETYIGALSIGGRPYLFEVSWIAGGESAASSALAAIKTIRIQ
jgi:hypothetical protein